MDAKEANKIAVDYNQNKGQYVDIMNQISELSEKGKHLFIYKDSINNDIREKLTKKGYRVGKTIGYNHNISTYIMW